jgi:hypothetical protein
MAHRYLPNVDVISVATEWSSIALAGRVPGMVCRLGSAHANVERLESSKLSGSCEAVIRKLSSMRLMRTACRILCTLDRKVNCGHG